MHRTQIFRKKTKSF